MRSGHVFVVRGDATAVACDWRIVTSGTRYGVAGDVGAHWLKDERVAARVNSPGWPDEAPNADRRAVVIAPPRPAPNGRPGVLAVHTGAEGTEAPSWFAEALTAAAAAIPGDAPRHLPQRALPLLVTPLLGTGAGGAGGRRTGVLEALLEAAERVAADGWDVVLVVTDAQTFSAAQRVRAERARWDLNEGENAVAEELAAHARADKLVPFVGAGASAAAGLPGWRELLEHLAEEVGIDAEPERKLLEAMDPRDAARLLERRLRARNPSRTLDAALRTIFGRPRRPSLVHCLLGSLPIREAATTNYDRLFEPAWHAASGAPVTTLPRDHGQLASRWLLKLHGDIDGDTPLILSRDQYLRFEQRGSAIAGVLHAMLLTRHLLIVGYGLSDETFHRIAYDVREVLRSSIQETVARASVGQRLGTALLATPLDLTKEIWSEDLQLVDLTRTGAPFADAARRQEILLDRVAHLAAPLEAYVLGDGWQELTTRRADTELRESLGRLGSIRGLDAALQRSVDEVLERFGRPPPDRR
jgi:hypothetical protein